MKFYFLFLTNDEFPGLSEKSYEWTNRGQTLHIGSDRLVWVSRELVATRRGLINRKETGSARAW